MTKLYKSVLLCTLTSFASYLQAQNKLAFIYKADSTEAASYKTFLSGYGFETHLVEMQQIGNHDFSAEKLIISGSNSSDSWSTWGTPNDVAIIKNTKKPILAFCYGGSGLFYKLGLWNNGGNSANNGFGKSLKVFNPLDAMYNLPYKVALNADSTFEPFSKTSCGNYLYTGGSYPTHITLHDRSNVSTYKSYAGLVSDSSKYYYLGYAATNATSDFTAEGQRFFVNLVYQAGQYNFVVTGLGNDHNSLSNSILFPNPSKGTFHVQTREPINHMNIYNSIGHLIAEIEQPNESLDLSYLKAGVYTVQIQYTHKVEFTKIVIE